MRKKYSVVFIVVSFLIMIMPNVASAKTLQDLYNELATLKSKQAAAASNKKMTTSEINALNGEINTVQSQINTTKNEIVAATNKIAESEKKIKEKKEETNELLRFLQLSSSENALLEYLFDAEDYTDFIYRYAVVSQLSKYNTDLMNELATTIKELENSKVTLANKQSQLEKQSTELTAKMATLKANLSTLIEAGTTIAEDIEAKQKDINYYEAQGCSRNQDITTCVKVPSSTGWNLPIVGGAYVTSEYQIIRTDCYGCGGVSHRGIDLGVPEGTKVYATAAGRVAYIVRGSSCGGNMVYIYHYVNGGYYTSVYMHLYSINVAVNSYVDAKTVIGTSGGGSTASRNGGYDNCTTGAHLHFGIAYGNDVSRFNANSFNPRNLAPFAYGNYLRR